MTISTSNFSKLLWPGLKAIHDNDKALPTEYTAIFDKETSDKAYEEYQGMSMFGLAPVKPQGAPISYDGAKQGFTTRLTNVVYALGFVITREMRDDGQYGPIARRLTKALTFSMRQTKEIVAANVLNRAFTSTYTGGDGKELCATDHPHVAGGTWANEPTVNVDLSGAALEDAAIAIMGFTNDRGLLIACKPKKLIIPPALTFEAERILKSALEYDTSNNAVNAIKSSGMFQEGVTVNHFLNDPDAWFIKTDSPMGLIYQERDADDFSPAPENDFDTDNAKFKARMRFAFGWIDPRCVYGCTGA